MDNNLSEATVTEKGNYKVLMVLILITLLVIAGWYFLSKNNLSQPNSEVVNETNNQSQLDKSVSIDGTVSSIDLFKNELTISASTLKGGVMNNENIDTPIKDRVVKVSQGTVIQKLIVSKDADGMVNRSGGIEMNLSDLHKGDKVSVIYNGLENDKELDNVKNISLVYIADNFDEKYQGEYGLLQASLSSISYLKGKVSSVNGNNIEYSLYAFNNLGTEKYITVVQSDTKIYAISDTSRLSIAHAKRNISIDKIKAGDDIFISNNGSLSTNETTASEIVVVSNE